jgi:tetratricopeptide (TPR) repeat protein
MADIFISYSSKHRDLTRKLAALLEKEGYSVWWDHALESWGSYEAQIRAASESARVVVVIWNEAALKSDWVYAEAKRANDARKLVNALPPGLPLSLVRQPFDAHHIDSLDLAEPHRLLRSIRGVWTGRPHATAKPLHEHYQEAFGVSLFDPKRTPLDRDGADPGPAELLQARHEAVPYIDATGLAEDMLAWCRDGTRTTAGRLVHGPGGFGKTRLMIETARRLRAEHWLAGFLQPPRRPDDVQEMRQREQALEQAFALGGDDEPGVLMVVDYAEGRQTEVATLARMLAGQPHSGRPVRLVLLARGDGWWEDFHQETEGVERLFRAPGTPLGDVRSLTPIPAGEARKRFFDGTLAAFAPLAAGMACAGLFPAWDGRPPRPERLQRLGEEPAYGRPLALQMEALLHLASAAPEARGPDDQLGALLGRVLGLEQAHWQKLLGPLDDNRRRDLGRATAQVTAVQGVDGVAAAERLLMADGFYEGARTARVQVDPVRRDLGRLYGKGDGSIAQLEPDLLGEHHVAGAADVELIDGCLRWVEEGPEADRPKRREALLTVLQRATQPEHGARLAERACGLIDHVVSTHAALLGAEIVSVARDTPGALLDRVQAAVPDLDEAALAALDGALPLQSLRLMDLSLAVADTRVQLARHLRSAAEGATEGERVAVLNHLAARVGTLGIRLSNLGRREEALAASKEAVDIRRALAKERPDAFLPDLARSLNNLGGGLSNLGRREEALAASKEAVDIYRALAKERPDAFLPDLAGSLNNLGIRLSNLGRREEALAASKEAVDIRRALAKERPDAFLPDLARSLSVMSDALAAMERHAEAAAAAQEALATLAPYVERYPQTYADLARTIASDVLRYAEAAGVEPDLALLQRVARLLGDGNGRIGAAPSGQEASPATDTLPPSRASEPRRRGTPPRRWPWAATLAIAFLLSVAALAAWRLLG